MSRLVGHVVGIARFPVKSMAGEERASADIDWQGMEGDRQYAFVKRDDRTRFPWFTGRDLSMLVRYRATFDDPDAPRTSTICVVSPEGERLDLRSDTLRERLEAASGRALALIQLGSGCYDAMPLSVVSTASLQALKAAHGVPLDPRRFRANIVVESQERDERWSGRLGFGEGAELLLAAGAPRCAMVTIDPETGERDAGVLRTVAQAFGNAFTTYASVARPGGVRLGDPVWID